MRLVIILFILTIPVSLSLAQQGHGRHRRTGAPLQSPSVQAPRKDAPASGALSTARPDSSRFLDADGDGIGDRAGAQRATDKGGNARARTRACDRFIDADGDGINDARCGGIRPMFRGKHGAGRRF